MWLGYGRMERKGEIDNYMIFIGAVRCAFWVEHPGFDETHCIRMTLINEYQNIMLDCFSSDWSALPLVSMLYLQ